MRVPSDQVEKSVDEIEPVCMYCGYSEGHAELVHTGDENSLDGFEVWFCCHKCRDHKLPCETFFKLRVKP